MYDSFVTDGKIVLSSNMRCKSYNDCLRQLWRGFYRYGLKSND
jgi:hypothetical protein